MKLSKPLVIVLVAAFTALAVVMAIPAIFSSESAYDNYLKEARAYNEQNLCEKAMIEYDKALSEEDSLALRIEMAANYKQGLDNGEFKSLYKFSDFLFDLLDTYRKDSKAYDTAAQYLYDLGRIEDCVLVIYQAEDLGITSDTVNTIREKIRYQCATSFGSFQDVVLTHEGAYLMQTDKYILYTSKVSSFDGVRYEYATPMLNGFALVKTPEYTYLISADSIREAYFPEELTSSTGVGNSLIAVEINGEYQYYDLTGKVAFGKYDFAGRFANGVAPVRNGDKWSLIGTDGQQITDLTFEDIKLSQTNDCSQSGLIFAKSNGEYHLYDCSLNKVSDLAFEDADVFTNKGQMAAVKMNGKWGYVNAKGELMIEAQYEDAKSFSNGLAGVKDGEFWSFINEKNEIAITGQYTGVNYFNANGYCFVKEDGYWFYLMRYYNK